MVLLCAKPGLGAVLSPTGHRSSEDPVPSKPRTPQATDIFLSTMAGSFMNFAF